MELDDLIHHRRIGKPVSLGHSVESMILGDFVDCYLGVRSPFDGLMEAPAAVNEAYLRHADACRAAAEDLRAAIRPVLEELFAAAEHEEQRRRGDLK